MLSRPYEQLTASKRISNAGYLHTLPMAWIMCIYTHYSWVYAYYSLEKLVQIHTNSMYIATSNFSSKCDIDLSCCDDGWLGNCLGFVMHLHAPKKDRMYRLHRGMQSRKVLTFSDFKSTRRCFQTGPNNSNCYGVTTFMAGSPWDQLEEAL